MQTSPILYDWLIVIILYNFDVKEFIYTLILAKIYVFPPIILSKHLFIVSPLVKWS